MPTRLRDDPNALQDVTIGFEPPQVVHHDTSKLVELPKDIVPPPEPEPKDEDQHELPLT